ncbi:MAG: septum formation initiator family protein [Candidatus Omnitrophota bacterium]
MNRRKLIRYGLVLLMLAVIYFPGFSRLQQLKEENRALERKIEELKGSNTLLIETIRRLETDPVYVEKVAREKMKKTRQGEIIYKTD